MSNQEQYVTIAHYKEREFYFLSHAIQTENGFIPKEMEQFHESDKAKFIDRIEMLQSQYPNNHVVSISLNARQTISDQENRNKASAEIFKHNYVIQDFIDIDDIPTTLYFSPFAILYDYYKDTLDDSMKLIIGLFDRKLFMMFATADKIHQSWIIGTRGLTEKQVAERVYKSMQAYYKISYSFADHLEMLVTDESPKLLKVLREELSLHITLTQNSIHNLLHNMANTNEKANSSFIKAHKKIEYPTARPSVEMEAHESLVTDAEIKPKPYPNGARVTKESLDNIKLNQEDKGLLGTIKSLFSTSKNGGDDYRVPYMAALPLFLVLSIGTYFSMQNGSVVQEISLKNQQITAHQTNVALAKATANIFGAMGKNGELKKATISTQGVELQGMVWGIEPLKKSLNEIYAAGQFNIKPLENFMTEFTFKSK